MRNPADAVASVQPEPRRDRYGRYLLPDPQTGREQPWTRATTLAKTLSDMFGLTKWQCRMVAKGLAARPDLYALAVATPIDDKTALDRLVEDAKEAAAASSGARLGQALHAFTEHLDAGEQLDIPAPWHADTVTYQETLRDAGITINPHHIERIVVLPQLGVAGTFDRILAIPDAGQFIGDLKTGRDLTYGWGEIAIQLALYANAELMWNPATGRYEPMPEVSRSDAVVIHLPVGQAKCDLYWIDITAGWEKAQLCDQVRQWRSRTDLYAKFTPRAIPPAPPQPNGWLQRIDKARTEDDLLKIWQDATHADAWDDKLLDACKRRKAQLQEGAAMTS
jgi:hypothetical protein